VLPSRKKAANKKKTLFQASSLDGTRPIFEAKIYRPELVSNRGTYTEMKKSALDTYFYVFEFFPSSSS
jgi:hypothetical protein